MKTPQTTTQDWMTLGEAAKIVNCSEQTMRAYADNGRLESTRIGPRGWRLFERAKVEAFAQSQHAHE